MDTPLRENRLLAALPIRERDRLTARMKDVTFNLKDVVYAAGGSIDYVYFPRSGVLSAVIVMLDGSTVEVGAIGSEGAAGVAAFLGESRSPEEVICQVPRLVCRRMPAEEFAREVERCAPLRQLLHGYLRVVLLASARFTACNRLHSVTERCARWLLAFQDRLGADEFPLTQEFLAQMLGVRRATATVSAAKLQAAGIITYRHGNMRIVDRRRLMQAACECYGVIHHAFQRMIG